MKTYFLLATLFLVPLSFIIAQPQDESEAERKRIVESNIKTITQWTHRFSQGQPSADGYKTTETHYDRRGNVVEVVNYRANGNVSSRLLYKYNDDNLRTEYIMYQPLRTSEPEVSYKQNFHYNSEGQRILEIVFDGGTSYRITYSYMPDGRPKEIVKYARGNQVDERWEYSYEGNVQIIRIFKDGDDLTELHRKYFDDKGNMIKDQRLDAAGNERRRIEFKYDASGRKIDEAEYFSGNLTKRLQYKYNNLGQINEIVQHNPDGSQFVQAKYTYDSNGNLLEERWSDNRTQEFSHRQSTYDGEGHVLKTDSYFAPYRYRVLYKYTYEYY